MIKKVLSTALAVVLAFGVFGLPVFAAALKATPTASTVLVNGKNVSFDAYNIEGSNYFKLRDLAYTLNGTQKQFAVGWDSANDAISLKLGQTYEAVGGEMESKGSGSQNATPTGSKVYLDGKEVKFTAYNIGGNNYFKLRDIGQAFDFSVEWEEERNTIAIDTSKGYTAPETASGKNEYRVEIYANGMKYEGNFVDGIRNGQGTMIFPDGAKYEGEWKDGAMHGRGIFTWPNGDKHEGEWRNNKANGQGIYTFANGGKYEGNFVDDFRSGQGTMIFPDGAKYEGIYANHLPNGQGIFTWPNGDKYEGEWKDDKAHGQGIFTFANGDRYEGGYENGARSGQGIMEYADGAKYEGEWKNNVPHGKGIWTNANGVSFDVVFENGKLVSEKKRD